MGDKLTHINDDGEVHMVDVGAKNVTQRQAVATSNISMSEAAFEAVKSGNLKKRRCIRRRASCGHYGGEKHIADDPLVPPADANQDRDFD